MKKGDTIILPENLHDWAEAQATAGGFDSVDEYVSQVLREERKRLTHEAIERKLLEAIESGPRVRLTEALKKELRELSGKQLRKRPRRAS